MMSHDKHGIEVSFSEIIIKRRQFKKGADLDNRAIALFIDEKTHHFFLKVQVEPQNYWDIRILSHVCTLFGRQFIKGFSWKQLEKDKVIFSRN
jgi:hypothetical protein